MFIKFFGVRGSIPSPVSAGAIKQKITACMKQLKDVDPDNDAELNAKMDELPFWMTGTYGGNTSCIYVNINGTHIILDCGSGLRELGQYLLPQGFGKGEGTSHIFISHTHWDHIQGIPFFVPAYIPGNNTNFYSCCPNIRERLEGQQNFDYFPVPFSTFGSNVTITELDDSKELTIGDIKLTFLKMFHPNDAWATSIEYQGKKFVYTADSEFNMRQISEIDKVVQFLSEADLVVMDTMYTAVESWQKIDWGHSSVNVCIDIALKAKAKVLVSFHHEPNYTDKKIFEQHENTGEYVRLISKYRQIDLHVAYEGLEFNL